jgi:hypothetical protein
MRIACPTDESVPRVLSACRSPRGANRRTCRRDEGDSFE